MRFLTFWRISVSRIQEYIYGGIKHIIFEQGSGNNTSGYWSPTTNAKVCRCVGLTLNKGDVIKALTGYGCYAAKEEYDDSDQHYYLGYV